MRKSIQTTSLRTVWWMGLACVGGIGAILGLSSTQIPVSAKAERRFQLPTDMDTFRQILVHTNANEAILNHCGMTLLEETTESVAIDLKNDSRPLRNFLRGKSKANVTATKHLKVQLNDPQINAVELLLTQHSRIHPQAIRIETASDGPSGDLQAYRITLEATKAETGIDLVLRMAMTIDVRVSRVFLSEARVRVEQAAVQKLKEQEDSLRCLVQK